MNLNLEKNSIYKEDTPSFEKIYSKLLKYFIMHVRSTKVHALYVEEQFRNQLHYTHTLLVQRSQPQRL